MNKYKYIGNSCLIIGGICFLLSINAMNLPWFIFGIILLTAGITFNSIYDYKKLKKNDLKELQNDNESIGISDLSSKEINFNRSQIDSVGICFDDLPRNDKPPHKWSDVSYVLMGNKGSIMIINPTEEESEFLDGIYRKYSR